MGALQRQGPPGQEQGPAARYEEMATEAEKTRKLDFEEIQIPPGPRLGSVVVEPTSCPRVTATGCSSTSCPSACRATGSSG